MVQYQVRYYFGTGTTGTVMKFLVLDATGTQVAGSRMQPLFSRGVFIRMVQFCSLQITIFKIINFSNKLFKYYY